MNNSKKLVAFFSRSGENYAVGNVNVGNTEIVAKQIAKLAKADLYKIEPVVDYPINYEESTMVAKKELQENARPKIKQLLENIDTYDVIFLGYPNWWGTFPMIINTFLESFDFKGKTIIPFITHEGSGLSNTILELQEKMPESKVLNGLAIKGTNVRSEKIKEIIEDWFNNLEEEK